MPRNALTGGLECFNKDRCVLKLKRPRKTGQDKLGQQPRTLGKKPRKKPETTGEAKETIAAANGKGAARGKGGNSKKAQDAKNKGEKNPPKGKEPLERSETHVNAEVLLNHYDSEPLCSFRDNRSENLKISSKIIAFAYCHYNSVFLLILEVHNLSSIYLLFVPSAVDAAECLVFHTFVRPMIDQDGAAVRLRPRAPHWTDMSWGRSQSGHGATIGEGIYGRKKGESIIELQGPWRPISVMPGRESHRGLCLMAVRKRKQWDTTVRNGYSTTAVLKKAKLL
ncbi:hypothetical protein QBC44DRAFT_313768 [Cladorrhinum sp. PSN332]|nr:hypothetical protein QBC44DRAFT_313768 [Cladorrhinum sp. PSN332]